MKVRSVCVLGGTGFVGRHLVTRLANGDRQVRVLTRRRERHRELTVMPRVELVEASVGDAQALAGALEGFDAVVNLIGILNQDRHQRFQAIHAELPRTVAQACEAAGVKRLLHMSALNAAHDAPSEYLRTKAAGEDAAHEARSLVVTSFRPSVIFGPDDSFFNRFAALLRISPVLPLACPGSRFAPVYVEDVAAAFETALERPEAAGQRLELCGPRTYTLRELVEHTARMIGVRRLVVGLPDPLARLQARVMEHVPGKPFTMDNYLSLQVDSVCHSDGLGVLGITPQSVEGVMPGHFGNGGQRGRYREFRSVARR